MPPRIRLLEGMTLPKTEVAPGDEVQGLGAVGLAIQAPLDDAEFGGTINMKRKSMSSPYC